MPFSINPIFPVIAAQGASTDIALQPGTVIDAQVLKVLANNMVRIAIAKLSIEVMSEIPLQAGQALQLAVTQTTDGIKLAVVGQGAGGAPQTGGPVAGGSAGLASDTVTLAPDTAIDRVARPAAIAQPQAGQLTAMEALAVSGAAQSAATRQAGLSQLFADLDSAAVSEHLPPALRQAVVQLSARRPTLDTSLSAGDVKAAFQNSGLFLEKSLASGPAASAAGGVMPDLKAALIVFRQILMSQPGTPPTEDAPRTSTPLQQTASNVAKAPAAPFAAAGGSLHPDELLASSSAPPLMPDIDAQDLRLPQARLPLAEDVADADGSFRTGPPGADAKTLAGHAAAARMALNLLQEALSPADDILQSAQPRRGGAMIDEGAFARTNTPPPPFRGALPSAQSVAMPLLAIDASPAETVHHLLQDTDAALARQTLLQVASLPDRADTSTMRNDAAISRWNFEIPFATPMGTAVAQFEIARDGSEQEVEAAKRVWRARFSLDIEPAGPVHALVSLVGETTSVRMWAERPATASRLRAGASQLSHALSRAELTPGDIVVRDGTPPQTATAPAGHFVDRAL